MLLEPLKRTALLVEGDGDVESFPLLFRKLLSYLELEGNLFPDRPIRVGDPTSAIKSEKFLRLFKYAIGSSNIGSVVICLDCDDYCPLTASRLIYDRVNCLAKSFKKPVGVCLFEREYESMFLACLPQLAQIYDEIEVNQEYVERWKEFRDAKGRFNELLGTRRYKETRDQARYTNAIEPMFCCNKYRSLRHLANVIKWISERNYVNGYVITAVEHDP